MVEASSTTPERATPPEEFHWVAAYLREDIQDIRNEIRGANARMDGAQEAFGARCDKMEQALGARIDRAEETLNGRIDRVEQTLNERIDALGKRLDARFTWLMSTMVAMAGILIAVIKI